jgi:enoyl-CoA hydratase
MRNTPDAHAFIDRATQDGVKAATNDRDAPFGDYSMAGPDRRPDPSHVIDPS